MTVCFSCIECEVFCDHNVCHHTTVHFMLHFRNGKLRVRNQNNNYFWFVCTVGSVGSCGECGPPLSSMYHAFCPLKKSVGRVWTMYSCTKQLMSRWQNGYCFQCLFTCTFNELCKLYFTVAPLSPEPRAKASSSLIDVKALEFLLPF